MRRINSVLLFFVGSVALLLVAAWWILQTRYVAKHLSQTVMEITEKHLDIKLDMRSVRIHLFPPGLGLEGVRFKHSSKEIDLDVEAGELGVRFSIFSAQLDKFSFHRIFLREAHIVVKTTVSDDPQKMDDPYIMVKQALKDLPVHIGGVTAESTFVKVDDVSLDVSEIEVENRSHEFKATGIIKQVKIIDKIPQIDQVSIDAALTEGKVTLREVSVIDNLSKATVKGEVTNIHQKAKVAANLSLNSTFYLPDQDKWVPLKFLDLTNGIMQLKSEVKIVAGKLIGNLEALITNVESNVAEADSIKVKANYSDKHFTFDEIDLLHKDSRAQLARKFNLWRTDKKAVPAESLQVHLKDLDLRNALQIIGPSIYPLTGMVSGKMLIDIRNEAHDVDFIPEDGALINGLGLEIDGKVIAKSKLMKFKDAEIHLRGTELDLQTKLFGYRSQLGLVGSIGKGKVNFAVQGNPINMEELGDLANLGVKGEGPNKITVSGPLEDVVMAIRGEFKNFEILGYKLGATKHEMGISLKNGTVELPQFSAQKGKYKFSGDGIVGYKDFSIDLNVDIPLISWSDLYDAIPPLHGGLKFLPEDFTCLMQGNVEIKAKGDTDKLVILTEAYAQNILAYGESFRDARFGIDFRNKKIRVTKLAGTKEEGKIAGDVSYDMTKSELRYDMKWSQLGSDEFANYRRFPFGYKFTSSGNATGRYTSKGHEIKGKTILKDATINNRSVSDSTIEIDIGYDRSKVQVDLLSPWIKGNLTSSNGQRDWRGEVITRINDLPLFISGFIGDNIRLSNVKGVLNSDTRFAIPQNAWNKFDLDFHLQELEFKGPDVAIDGRFNSPQIAIRGGRIERWDLKLLSGGINFTSGARGTLGGGITILTDVEAEARYLEFLSRHILRAEGRIGGKAQLFISDSEADTSFEARGTNVSLTADNLPFSISALNYQLKYARNRLDIINLSFRPESGHVKLLGDVYWDDEWPEMNVRYFLERTNVPFKPKSNIVITGDGLLFGGKKPYTLNGDITINRGSVLDEFSEFTNSTGAQDNLSSKYLPKDRESAFAGLVNLDINAKTETPVNINNTLVDIFLAGNLQVLGDAITPSAEGKVYVTGNQSKVFFKNNEYLVSKGEFLFNGKRDIKKPDFDVAANTVISNYKITAKAFGNPDSFTFDLISDPPLGKDNILSLIAFGYTDDLSNSISPEERQNLTQMGVGSFIFDQFKISGIVKKQFGLQINLGTQFEQADSSLLQGRSQGGGGNQGLGSTRSATKIEVKKRLSEALNLSVTSTLGGSIGQRQSMNLNYGINRTMQVEGVYELRTNAEGEEDLIDNSIGADLKFRWSFK